VGVPKFELYKKSEEIITNSYVSAHWEELVLLARCPPPRDNFGMMASLLNYYIGRLISGCQTSNSTVACDPLYEGIKEEGAASAAAAAPAAAGSEFKGGKHNETATLQRDSSADVAAATAAAAAGSEFKGGKTSNKQQTNKRSKTKKRGSKTQHADLHSKRHRTSDDRDVHPVVNFLKKCGATVAIIENVIALQNSQTDNPIKKVIISLLGLIGNESISMDDMRHQFKTLKQELHNAFMQKSGDKYKGRLNFGDCLSYSTALVILKHYAPFSCIGKPCEGDYNVIFRKNPCIAQFIKVLPHSLHKEAGGDDWTDQHSEKVSKRLRFIDMLILVPMEKETVEEEFENFAKEHNVSIGDLELISFIFYSIHVMFYNLVHMKKEPLTVLCASSYTHNDYFGRRDEFANDKVRFLGNVPHGQVWASRTIKNIILYPAGVLEKISAQILLAYTSVAEKVECFSVPTIANGSRIAQRFAGNLTNDEMKALLETLIESCRKGGRKSGQMRTDAATLVKQLKSDGWIETKEDAFEYIGLFLSVEHQSLYEGL